MINKQRSIIFLLLAVNNPKLKLGKFHLRQHQKEKILRIYLTKDKTCTLKPTKRHWKKLKKTQINGKTAYNNQGSEDLILLRWQTPKTDLGIQYNPCQNPIWLLRRKWQADRRIHNEMQGARNNQTMLGRKNKDGGLTPPDFKVTTTLRVIKISWCLLEEDISINGTKFKV